MSAPLNPDSDTFCEDCFSNPPPHLQCISPFLYHFPIDQLISRMKYQGRPQLSKVLADLMIAQIEKKKIPRSALPHALIPVPMHPKKQRQRGYNQATYLAKHLAKHFNIPLITDGLLKTHLTDAQRSLKAANRHSNLQRSFSINPKVQQKLKRLEHIALIDDVMTTGATARVACQCLKDAGVPTIDVWTIARTP